MEPQEGRWRFVKRLDVRKDYLDGFEPQLAGGRDCEEYWIPATQIGDFNAGIVGTMTVVEEYPAEY